MSPALLYETVQVAKEFLDVELAKYATWEDFDKYPNKSIRVLFKGVKGDFLKAKKQPSVSTWMRHPPYGKLVQGGEVK